jgi:hypothetical protein
MTRREFVTSASYGLLAGAGIMLVVGVRVAIAITAGHRWNVARQFFGIERKSWKR